MTSSKSLDLSSIEKAITQLETSLNYYHSNLSQHNEELKKLFIAATIQAFEFSYELSVKFLRRYLEMSEPSAGLIEEMSFPNLIRTVCERGLLQNDWQTWKHYRDKRNITSYTYDEVKAHEVMTVIPEFLEEIKYLLNKLKERIKTL